MQSGFIAAIDLGTSKITGVIGRKNENGVISVLACDSISSDNCIRRGLVYNIEETGAKIRKLVTMLENRLNRKVGKVYVSLAGQSLHTVDFREMRQLTSSGIITENVVEQLRAAARKFAPELKRNYAIADVEYFVDDKPEKNPVGVSCSQIEANFELVVGRPSLLSNIEKSVTEKAQMPIADYIVGPIAAAAIALSDEEKELGCAFIDFGAGTTSLSIYKGGILRKMVTIPFGGRNITKDICGLNFIESEAEQLKVKFGKVFEANDNSFFNSPFSSKPDVDMKELNKVILLRLDEITANLVEQIKLSGFQGQLGAGVVITGGASLLKNLDLYLKDKLEMPVRKASAKKAFINNSSELANDPSLTEALGLLLCGTEDCEYVAVENHEGEDAGGTSETPASSRRINELRNKVKKDQKKREKKEEKKHSSGNGLFSKIENVLGNMFSDDDDDE